MDILNRIISLLEIQHKTQKDLTDYLGVQNTTFTKWKAGDNTSYMKYLPKIATFLSVSADYLITGEPPEQKINPPEIEQSVSSEEKKKAPLVWGYDDDSVGWVHINTKKDKTNISENLDVESQNELDIELFKLIQQLPDSEKYKLIGRIQTTLELLK